jgi:hypothetical protein
MEISLNSRDPIKFYPGAWLQKLQKNIQGPNWKCSLNLKTAPFPWQLLIIFIRDGFDSKWTPSMEPFQSGEGACFTPPWCTPAVTKKCLRPLAIKARGETEPRKEGPWWKTRGGEKQKRGNDREESKRRGNKRDRKQREIQEKEF